MLLSIKSFLKHYGAGLIAVFVTWGAYFTALFPKMLFRTAEGVFAGDVVWADWAAHLAYANVFALKNISDWFTSHPLYLGFPFNYPFVADAISGFLMRAGLDRMLSFILPSIVTVFLFLIVLYAFYAKELRASGRAFAAVTLFLANGGLGFLLFFADLAQNPTWGTLLFPPQTYTHLIDMGIRWISIVTSELLPQRALLLGMPITLLILMKISGWTKNGFAGVHSWKILLLGFLAGILPVIHTHSFLALALFSGILTLFNLRSWRQWLLFALPATLISFSLYILLYQNVVGNGFFEWHPGWLANSDVAKMSFLRFLLINWGVFTPVALAAILRLRYYEKPLILGAIILFVLSSLFQFQPHLWDNTKLFTWSYLILVIPAIALLADLWRRGVLLKVAVSLIFVTMTASGFLDVWRVTRINHTRIAIWSAEEETLARSFQDISEPTDVVLTSDKHNHWVPMLSGRQIVMGYRGWAWTYGIDYRPIEQDVRAMFAGGNEAIRLLDEYKVKYAVIGPTELADYGANEEFFSKRFEKVLEGAGYRVYRINIASG